MIRSESTSALGHPSETKLIFGAAACCIGSNCVIDRPELNPFGGADKAVPAGWTENNFRPVGSKRGNLSRFQDPDGIGVVIWRAVLRIGEIRLSCSMASLGVK
ncbi:hypothetical protein [Rhodopseudomonas palustris]|uniref:hypothetical protein n=1 Tax=Rhodopseudomonas palustris TaxID=1076 RepID=UPI0018DD3D36|nr:hypothetical protein [Rhodopseudomonas palustris]